MTAWALKANLSRETKLNKETQTSNQHVTPSWHKHFVGGWPFCSP